MAYLSGQTARVCAIAIGFGPCLMAAEGMAYHEVLVIAQDAWKSACADALSASLEDRQSIATDEYGAKA